MKKILFLLTIFFSFIINIKAISNITINNNMLVPEFSKDINVYNVFVSSNTEIITINANKEDVETVKGIGSISLKYGLNKVEVISYVEDNIKEKYILNITRGDIVYDRENSKLENIVIKGYDIKFKENIYNYKVKTSDINDISVEYETNNPYQTVSMKKDKNDIIIKVISQDKKHSSTYKINVLESKEIVVNNKKTSIFDNKEFTSFDLKLIIIGLILIGLIILGYIFYFMFIKKKKYFNPFRQNKRS